MFKASAIIFFFICQFNLKGQDSLVFYIAKTDWIIWDDKYMEGNSIPNNSTEFIFLNTKDSIFYFCQSAFNYFLADSTLVLGVESVRFYQIKRRLLRKGYYGKLVYEEASFGEVPKRIRVLNFITNYESVNLNNRVYNRFFRKVEFNRRNYILK